MSGGETQERTLLVDASVFITLSEVEALDALFDTRGKVAVPKHIEDEIKTEPPKSSLSRGIKDGRIQKWPTAIGPQPFVRAGKHLGKDISEDDVLGKGHLSVEGDTALLSLAISPDINEGVGHPIPESPIVVTDDKPLRETCNALSIPVSGSIGVLIRAAERGDVDPDEATDKLYAMDEVGARLSASLVRRAERLIAEAAEE